MFMLAIFLKPAGEKMKKKGAWSDEEDSMLKRYLENEGGAHRHRLNWNSISHKAGLNRCGKSCRLRWKNYLDPLIKRGNFSSQEEDLILRLQSNLGNKWAQIAKQLPGRTDNDIKNLWNTKLKKKKLQQEAISQLQQLQTPVISDSFFSSNHDYAILIAEAAQNSALQQWITMMLNQEWSSLQLQSMQPLISNDADAAANYNYDMLPALATVSPTEETISVNDELGNEIMSCETFVDLGVEVYAAGDACSFYYDDYFGVNLPQLI